MRISTVLVISVYNSINLFFKVVLGPREDYLKKKLHPVDVSEVYIGVGLMWFAWYGFNGSTEFAMNTRAINVLSNILLYVLLFYSFLIFKLFKSNSHDESISVYWWDYLGCNRNDFQTNP